ncbi:hypothetical protein DF039_37910 [Burkholderia cenocepacia]|nr:hypothetical protein DF039_37910 [Burkholderia cenocepacia]
MTSNHHRMNDECYAFFYSVCSDCIKHASTAYIAALHRFACTDRFFERNSVQNHLIGATLKLNQSSRVDNIVDTIIIPCMIIGGAASNKIKMIWGAI